MSDDIRHWRSQLPKTRLRVGDRVRSVVDDVNVSVGLCGVVVNVITRVGDPTGGARVLWENDTVSIAESGTFVVPRLLPAIPVPDLVAS